MVPPFFLPDDTLLGDMEEQTIFVNRQAAVPRKPKRRRARVLGDATALPPLRLTPRDIAIINACYEYRALTTPQIQRLFFTNSAARGQRVHCQYRLKLLYHHGYLYRDEQPTKLSEGRKPLVYFLDRKGAKLLAECLHVAPGDLDWRSKDNAAGAKHLFIDHLLKTNDIRIAMTLAAQQQHVTLERWLDDKTLKSRQMKEYVMLPNNKGEEQKVAIIPDGYVHLDTARGPRHHFLEADLRTMVGLSSKSGRRDWARKIRAYLAYKDSGLFAERYGAHSFRVLTVTTGQRRLENLKRITEESGGHARFWFTTFDQLTPETVLLAPIWQIAGRERQHALLHQTNSEES